MLFNSVSFFVFFPLVTFIYFLLPHRTRWSWLLLASAYFYMVFVPQYILILAAVILIDYCAGLMLGLARGYAKKIVLLMSLLANGGILFFFKYFNFFNTNLEKIAHLIHWNYPLQYLSILLPIGLSFHTFQSMSYTIEVYKGRQAPEKNLGIFALYVMFYPQLVAGPIERPQNLLPQLHAKHLWDWERAANGLKLMLWGLFKKAVIADRLAVFVNAVFNHPSEYFGISIVIAAVFFAFQIYCDFSGYSDIAIGAAEVMGIRLMKNFDRPYFSTSIAEFWTRWHISLTSWFRDYIYFPLGGSRVKTARWCFNILFVFFISGLWHGANWTFIAWGLLNGLYITVGDLTKNLRSRITALLKITAFPKILRWWQTLLTFALVSFSWIFFRANSIHEAVLLVKNLLYGWGRFNPAEFFAMQSGTEFFITLAAIAGMGIAYRLQTNSRSRCLKLSIYACMALAVIFFGVFKNQQFIYFQF